MRRGRHWEGVIFTGEEAMGLDGAPHLPAAQDAQHLRHLRDFKAINIYLPVRERERRERERETRDERERESFDKQIAEWKLKKNKTRTFNDLWVRKCVCV